MTAHAPELLRDYVKELGAIIYDIQALADDADHEQLDEVLSTLRQAHHDLEAIIRHSEA